MILILTKPTLIDPENWTGHEEKMLGPETSGAETRELSTRAIVGILNAASLSSLKPCPLISHRHISSDLFQLLQRGA